LGEEFVRENAAIIAATPHGPNPAEKNPAAVKESATLVIVAFSLVLGVIGLGFSGQRASASWAAANTPAGQPGQAQAPARKPGFSGRIEESGYRLEYGMRGAPRLVR
jgi:hypothetical protein